jgi:peptide/nickel transport system ATP-binding protein
MADRAAGREGSVAPALLEIRNATKIYGGGFLQPGEPVVALHDFNLTIAESPATITTIAGESGSGKTTLANAVLGFVGLTSGQVLYQGHDVATLSRPQQLQYRRDVQAVFQDPYEVYNPFYRVKHVFDLVIRRFHLARNGAQTRELIEGALRIVGLRGEEILEKYPHQLSGGQRQRVMVARAFLLKPRLIVADEPVSMVDASLRAMILDIMLRLRDDHEISFLYITHDLSTAYQISDRIYILYRGSVAEKGVTAKVIEDPRHPYVQLLLNSIPVPDPSQRWETVLVLPGDGQGRNHGDRGCRFYARCPFHWDRCLVAPPPLYAIDGADHHAACYRWEASTGPESGYAADRAGS